MGPVLYWECLQALIGDSLEQTPPYYGLLVL